MVDHELEELRREFLAEAEEKVREMEGAVTGGRDSGSLERLAYLAHQLKGSGGSYGYQRISAESAEIERAAEQLGKGEGVDGLDAKIRQHVVNLREEITRGISELTTA